MPRSTGRGHAKVILLGEHTVVHGVPALAVALDRGITVTVDDGPAPLDTPQPELDEPARQALETMAAKAGEELVDLTLWIDSEIPSGAGLGSSAALSVAFAKALLERSGEDFRSREVLALAGLGEAVFHGAPSGIDAAVAAVGGALRYCTGDVPPRSAITLAAPVPLVIADSGQRAATHVMVSAVAALRASSPPAFEALLDLARGLVEVAEPALAEARWDALGHCMSATHTLLQRMGVSTDVLNRGVEVACEAGAAGAKLTGAGGGGCLIALAPDPDPVAAALRSAGFEVMVEKAGAGL